MHPTDTSIADPRLALLCEKAARFCALAGIALGASVLIGWWLDVAALKTVLPGAASMKINTALSFLLAGVSLHAAGLQNGSPAWRSAHIFPGALVALIGMLTTVEYGFGVDLGVDQLLFAVPAEPISHAPPGRMALATAVAFTLTGAALLLLDSRRGRLASQAAALAGNLIGVLAVMGYAYDVESLYGVGAYSSVALHTAIGFVAVNFGILVARPRRGLMAVVTSRTLGGVMARRLLPLALVAPFLIGWARVMGERLGYFDSVFGVALVALAYIALFSVFTWRTAKVLHESDLRRLSMEGGLRRQDAKLNGIIDSAMDAIIMVDGAQRIVLFNPAAAAMFRVEPADVLGQSLDVLLPQRFREAHSGHLRDFSAKGVTNRRMGGLGAIVGARADGEEFPIEASIAKLDMDGECYCTVILRDITERRRGEEQLKAATLEAERANDAKSRFLAAASHDLRQPLAAMRLYANVLRDKAPESEQALVASMDDCISVLSALLTDLLDLSKLQAGVVKPKIVDFSVFELLADLESVYMLKALAKGLRLRFQSSRFIGRGDPVLLKRIIGNFIENAIRYTERGGVVVGCRRRQGKAWVEVWDSGIGISPDKTAEIFEEFRQLGDAARNQGSGLGLAIVAKTAALLGLEFCVRSWPGKGSVFAIELPLGQAETAPVAAAPVGVHRPLRIALADDNVLVREAMLVALQGIGHQVVAAASGGELQVRLGKLPPDIVISDYRLARGETGFDVITAIRNAWADNLPAIIITGDTDPKLIASMAGRGVSVLHKPLDMNELQAHLDELACPAT